MPGLPKVVRKLPVLSNFWMRLLSSSTTKTLPLPSTATPRGTSIAGLLPHAVRNAPQPEVVGIVVVVEVAVVMVEVVVAPPPDDNVVVVVPVSGMVVVVVCGGSHA